jgi:hypothetical protein
MPGKLRHGKGKHHHLSKKSRARQRQVTMTPPQPVVADTLTPAAKISTPPSSGAPASPAKSRAIQYPYITAELRRIGILAGIIIVILIVLAQVLS